MLLACKNRWMHSNNSYTKNKNTAGVSGDSAPDTHTNITGYNLCLGMVKLVTMTGAELTTGIQELIKWSIALIWILSLLLVKIIFVIIDGYKILSVYAAQYGG